MCASNSSHLSFLHPYFGGPPPGGAPKSRSAPSRGDSRGSSFDGDRNGSRPRRRSEGRGRGHQNGSNHRSRPSPGGKDDKITWGEVNARTPPWDWLEAEPPDWQWYFAKKDEFRSYSVQESINLERYYQVHKKLRKNEALITLSRKKVLVNFEKMVASTKRFKWALERHEKMSDWLSSAYFFAAFTENLASSTDQIKEMFDFRYNQDYREFTHSPKMKRGGRPYQIPMGWKRFAVNVSHFPAEGDSNWLGDDSERSWAVAYHGTAKEFLPGILKEGFRIGAGQKFADCLGVGVYCANDIEVAQHYAEPKNFSGHYIQVVLQLRVRPEAIREVATCTDAKGIEREYWVINNQDDLRHYGVLVRELHPSEFVTALEAVYGPNTRAQDGPNLPPLKRAVFERTWKHLSYDTYHPYLSPESFKQKYGTFGLRYEDFYPATASSSSWGFW